MDPHARTIVVPIDASPLSLHALPLVRAVYRDGDALVFVTAVEPVPPFPLPDYPAAAERWARGRHEKAQAALGNDLPTAESIVLLQSPSVALVEYLERERPDVVVMATHGRGPVSRTWIGSMADRVIRSGAAPVLMVRPDSDEAPEPGTTRSIQRVLVPLDGSETAEKVMNLIARVVGTGVAVHLVSVVEHSTFSATPYLPHQVQETTRVSEERRAYLDGLSTRLNAAGWSVSAELLEADRASRRIVEAADSAGADLIAMATHGRGGLARIALGSVTDKVIRTSDIPILTGRPEGTGAWEV